MKNYTDQMVLLQINSNINPKTLFKGKKVAKLSKKKLANKKKITQKSKRIYKKYKIRIIKISNKNIKSTKNYKKN